MVAMATYCQSPKSFRAALRHHCPGHMIVIQSHDHLISYFVFVTFNAFFIDSYSGSQAQPLPEHDRICHISIATVLLTWQLMLNRISQCEAEEKKVHWEPNMRPTQVKRYLFAERMVPFHLQEQYWGRN